MSFLSEEGKEKLRDLLAGRSPLLIAIVAAVGALALICLFGLLLLTSDRVAEPPPTPFDRPPAAPDVDESLVVAITDSTTISIPHSSPVNLDVAGRNFSLQTQALPVDGTWAPALRDDDVGVWVYGTIVNYLVALRDSPENRDLLERLAPGDEMVMRMRDGSTYTFAFNSRRNVPVTSRDIFNQNAPGLTLILTGAGGDERLVVHGRYLLSEATDEEAGNVVELGETAQMNGLQVTVSGATYLYDRPEIPAGFAFYLVDFQMQNLAGAILDANQLRLTLSDDLGNQYALNPMASQLGNNPPLGGSINPGQTVQATAGYQIPAGLNSSLLRWLVMRSDSAAQIQVNIPFRGTSEAGQQAAISLSQAEVSLDGTSVQLFGEITNLGSEPLVVQETNVSLVSEERLYLALSTSPAFPWIVAPGQTTQFSLAFQRPSGSTAVFTILNQPFELTGLR